MQPQQAMAEVGEGNMNFPAILAACARAGVEWYAVEQDFLPGRPFRQPGDQLPESAGARLELNDVRLGVPPGESQFSRLLADFDRSAAVKLCGDIGADPDIFQRERILDAAQCGHRRTAKDRRGRHRKAPL